MANKQTIENELNEPLDGGIKSQDCNLVANAFERGVMFEQTEASVFAPMTRTVQNHKSFAQGAKKLVRGYKRSPKNNTEGKTSGMLLRNQYISIPDVRDGSPIARAIKECIPCTGRIIGSFDLDIGSQLLAILQKDVKARLKALRSLSDLFSNVDIYGDFCALVAALNSLCIPDLQRILVILAAMLSALGTDLFKLSGLLLALIAPLFLPILMKISSLMTQLRQLVLGPLICIINSINAQATKLDIEGMLPTSNSSLQSNKPTTIQKFQTQTRSGLLFLSQTLSEGQILIESKLDLYLGQLDKLLSQVGGSNISMLLLSQQKLGIVRLVALVRAMIKAKSKGFECKGPKPSQAEMDTFVTTFLNPYSGFNLFVDENNELHVASASDIGEGVTIKPNQVISDEVVSANGTVSTTNPTRLFGTVNKTVKCNIASDTDTAAQVNAWIQELNRI